MSSTENISYSDYLSLDRILDAQNPRSDAHDELLFIIQHQTSELWMQLALHELSAARQALINNEFKSSFKMLARVSRIFEQLNNAWDVLRTMTPSEYTSFRDALGSSSGFQSHQYRLIEFVLGNRNRSLLKVHQHNPDIGELLEQELQRPSLYHVAIGLLSEQTDTRFDPATLSKSEPHIADNSITDAWARVYEQPTDFWDLYELAEKLVDLEDYFRRWRFNHVTTVERIIGFKKGTGGTSGVKYLKQMLETELFPELWNVRGKL